MNSTCIIRETLKKIFLFEKKNHATESLLTTSVILFLITSIIILQHTLYLIDLNNSKYVQSPFIILIHLSTNASLTTGNSYFLTASTSIKSVTMTDSR